MYPYGQPQGYYPQGFQQQQFVPQTTGYGAPGYAPPQGAPQGFPTASPATSSPAIPNKQLSFLTPSDQQNFAQLFAASLSPGEVSISGDVARQVLLRSNLSNNVLGDIWQLADTQRSGTLLFPEFCAAMYLCSRSLRGEQPPARLPANIAKEVDNMIMEISASVPDSNTTNQTASAAAFGQIRAQQTGMQTQPQQQQPYLQNYLQQTPTGFPVAPPQPQVTGYMQPMQNQVQSQLTGVNPLQSQATGGYGLQSQTTGNYPLQSQVTGGYPSAQTNGYQYGQSTGIRPQLTGPAPPQYSSLQPQITGGLNSQLTGLQPQITGGLRPQITGGLQPQITGGLQPQITGGLRPQITGGLQPQITGGLQPQITGGLQPQITGGLQPQITGGLQPQITGGYVQPGLRQQATGPGMGLQPQITGGLQSQPTGQPGQWGFINAATPGLDTFQTQMLPQATGSTAMQMQSRVATQSRDTDVAWAISKQEKATYDGIFQQWDKQRTGYINGPTAINIFSKSGLERTKLESIWNLCDQQNRGKLGKDEFAVAMHLIYRYLNGHEVPLRLPPELVPPSKKHIDDSVAQMKQYLSQNSPKKTGASTSFNRYNSRDTDSDSRPSAAVFKNNDDDIGGGYRSAARHRVPTSKPATTATPQYESHSTSSSSSLADLAKLVREKRILLEAQDVQEEDDLVAQDSIESGNLRAISDLKDRIRDVQQKLGTTVSSGDASAGRHELLRKLQNMIDNLPPLMSKIRDVEAEISNTKVAIIRQKFEKDHPGTITGSGPGGAITEADRAAAKRKAELRARMAAITGKNNDAATAFEEFEKQLIATQTQAESERDANDRSLRALEESLSSTHRHLSGQLRSQDNPQADRDRRRWDEAVGVEPEVKDFILSLRAPKTQQESTPVPASASTSTNPDHLSSTAAPKAATPPAKAAPPNSETPAERIARIRAEAQRRTQERLAKAGIRIGSRNAPAESQPEPEPEPESESKPVAEAAVPPPQEIKSVPAAAKKPQEQSENSNGKSAQPDNDNESEDEEEKKLRQQLEEHRIRVQQKEAASAKKHEKAKRLAELRKQQEELAAREKAMQSDSEPEEEPVVTPVFKPSSSVQANATSAKPPGAQFHVASTVRKPQAPAPVPVQSPAQAPVKAPAPAPAPAPVPVPVSVPAPAAPSPATQSQSVQPPAPTQAASSTTSTGTSQNSYNPFAKKTLPPADDDWGSEAEHEESDDDAPRGGASAAQLASLLFGTMGPQRPPERSQSSTPATAPTIAPAVAPPLPAAPVAPAVPAAAVAEPTPQVQEVVAPAPPALPVAQPPAPPLPPTTVPETPSYSEATQHDAQYEGQQNGDVQYNGQAAASAWTPEQAYAQQAQYGGADVNADLPPEPFEGAPTYNEPYSAPPPVPSFGAPGVPSESPAGVDDEDFDFHDAVSEQVPSGSSPYPETPAPSIPVAPPPLPPNLPPMAAPAQPDNLYANPPISDAPAAPPLPPSSAPLPPPPPPPPPAGVPPPPAAAPAAPAPSGGMSMVLGEITAGRALRKVDASQQRISQSDLGRVV